MQVGSGLFDQSAWPHESRISCRSLKMQKWNDSPSVSMFQGETLNQDRVPSIFHNIFQFRFLGKLAGKRLSMAGIASCCALQRANCQLAVVWPFCTLSLG